MISWILLVLGIAIAWFGLGKLWKQLVVPYFRKEVVEVRTSIIPEQQRTANEIDDHVCCFCLAEPKIFRVVATCSHSFCADCILKYYRKYNSERIDCPLCRKEIITLFKAFEEKSPQVKIEAIRAELREYNNKFGDNRSIKRTIRQLPFVLRTIMDYLFSKEFVLFFVGNAIFLKAIAVIIIYEILPYDIMPAQLLGSIGYFDDTLVILVVLGFALGKVGLQFYRNNQ